MNNKPTPEKSMPIILIGGTGRSGTTILRKIIESHKDVATIPEWRFLSDPDGILEYLYILENSNPFSIDQAYRRLRSLFIDITDASVISKIIAKFSYLESKSSIRLTQRGYGNFSSQKIPNIQALIEEYLESLKQFEWSGQYAGLKRFQSRKNIFYPASLDSSYNATRNFLNKISDSAMKHQGKTRFLEKNTWSLLYLDIVLKLYPTGKFVHIYRDPRDVVASFCSQPWMPNDPIHSALILKDMYFKWWKARDLVSKNSYIEIGLDDLVTNPEKTLFSLCSFWNISYYDGLLDIDLSKSNSGRWKSDIPADLHPKINLILKDAIDTYGS